MTATPGPPPDDALPPPPNPEPPGPQGGMPGVPPPAVAPWMPATAPYPPGLSVSTHFDYLSGLTLPNGTELAGVGRRIGAYFLAIPLFIGTLGIGYIVWGLILWGRGQTPTYQLLKMRCWRPETGKIAGWGWMALREVVGRIAEGLTITAIVSLILFLTTKERRTLHDYIGGTIVVHDPAKALG